jgi:hypothetical protein
MEQHLHVLPPANVNTVQAAAGQVEHGVGCCRPMGTRPELPLAKSSRAAEPNPPAIWGARVPPRGSTGELDSLHLKLDSSRYSPSSPRRQLEMRRRPKLKPACRRLEKQHPRRQPRAVACSLRSRDAVSAPPGPSSNLLTPKSAMES